MAGAFSDDFSDDFDNGEDGETTVEATPATATVTVALIAPLAVVFVESGVIVTVGGVLGMDRASYGILRRRIGRRY